MKLDLALAEMMVMVTGGQGTRVLLSPKRDLGRMVPRVLGKGAGARGRTLGSPNHLLSKKRRRRRRKRHRTNWRAMFLVYVL